MRLLVTADLHFNHPRSRPLAEDLIGQMNRAGGDVLLLVGDTAVADGDVLEQCLSRFEFPGPKLFVAGNHELWTTGDVDSYQLLQTVLPRRVRALGWHWLQSDPFRAGEIAFVGTVGWYDYSLAPADLGIPRRFYEHKISPGAAERFPEQYGHLFANADDIPPATREVFARWNDAKFVRLGGRSDEQFLTELLDTLRAQLDSLHDAPRVIAAVHHLPFRELLPPPRNAQWDFAKAFLGSPRMGELLQAYSNVTKVYCGHSHYAAEAQVGHIHAVNIGSGYRAKVFKTVEL
jgi:3',5'-cyclic AMP phosphodiesterase CpdA